MATDPETTPPSLQAVSRPERAPATVHDVKVATAEEKRTAWRAAWLTTVGGVLAIVATILGAYFFAIDRAEAAGIKAGEQGVKDAAEAKKALELHVIEERDARRDMRAGIYRLEKKQDAMLMRWNIPNPAPTPTP